MKTRLGVILDCALLKAKKGFRRINGYAEIRKRSKLLQNFSPPPLEEASPFPLDATPTLE